MIRRIWFWFLIGFAATFCLLAMTITTFAVLPSGEGVARMKLWQFYLHEWPRFFGTHALGPASSNQDALVATTLQHIALAALGGTATAVVAWWLKRRISKRA